MPGNQSYDSDDDMPLTQTMNKRVEKRPAESMDSEDIPLSQQFKKNSASRPAIKEESSDEDDIPLSHRRHPSLKQEDTPMSSIKQEEDDRLNKKRHMNSNDVKRETKKVKKLEDDPDLYKWWEVEDQVHHDDDTIKWNTLQHQGVLFPPDYVPHGVQMKYDGVPIKLSPEAEEVASFYAALLETDHGKNPVFQKNFFEDWKEVLAKDPSNPKITKFSKCDFRPIWEKFEKDKEQKKLLTKEEKSRIKEEKQKIEEPYLYAIVDGRKEKVGNFRIEPPGLFRGRGSHPKTGKLKKRVLPEQVTLNLGKEAIVPTPPAGHKWASVVHDQTATWLATWKENVNGSIKYVFLAATSTWKGQSDMQKFEKARELKKYVKKIRADYTGELKDKLSEIRQRATAMYLIDRLALRAGNEKGEDEADTVGCCSLRYEHITLEPPNILHFDFLGKDSIRYQNTVEVDPQVFKNIKIFKKQVGEGNMIFDRLTTGGLNKYLNSCMKGLSAKVFRTFNASITFQQQVDQLTQPNDSIPDKLLSYNRANREVAILCNHQKSASKTHDQMIQKIEDRVRAFKYQRMKLIKQLFALDPKYKKQQAYQDKVKDELDREWIVAHEVQLVEKEREKIRNKFQKANEKLPTKEQAPASELTKQLKAADLLEQKLAKERDLVEIEPKANTTVEKILGQIAKIEERIAATKIQITDKEENKEIALGTSKLNYIDPRITVAWCRQHGVPQEKVFSKTLLEKFRWAQNIPDDWKF